MSDFHHTDLRRFGQSTSIDAAALRTLISEARVHAQATLQDFQCAVESLHGAGLASMPAECRDQLDEVESALCGLVELLEGGRAR